MSVSAMLLVCYLLEFINAYYRNIGPIPIKSNNTLCLHCLEIRDVVEITFDIRIYAQCHGNCRIFGLSDNLPLLYTYNGIFIAEFNYNDGTTYDGGSSMHFITNSQRHNIYLKFSSTQRVIIINNISYINITNGDFNHSDYIGTFHSITAVYSG